MSIVSWCDLVKCTVSVSPWVIAVALILAPTLSRAHFGAHIEPVSLECTDDEVSLAVGARLTLNCSVERAVTSVKVKKLLWRLCHDTR